MFVMLAGCGGGTKRANSGSTGAQGEGEHCLLAPDTTVDADIAASLNDRPRKTLGFMKPSEKLAELVAMTG